jgi:hypothetical protein
MDSKFNYIRINHVTDYNKRASEIMKFRKESDGNLRKTGYVVSWQHKEGGSGAKWFKNEILAYKQKDKMLKTGKS